MHDAAGNRHPCEERDTYLGNRLQVDVPAYTTTVTDDNASTSFDPYDVLHPAKLKTSLAAVTERYDFDGQNRLFEVTRDDIKLASALSRNGDYVTPASESATPFVMERRRYDALGQLLEVGAGGTIQGETLRLIYGAADPDQPKGNAMPSIGDDFIRMQYDKLGRMQRQTTLGSDRKFISTVSYQNQGGTGPRQGGDQSDKVSSALPEPRSANGYDLAGNVLQYTVFNASGPASTFTTDYVWRDGALVTSTTGYRDKAPRPGVTLKTYDGNGHIRAVLDPDDPRSDITRSFNTDASGTVLRSVQVGDQRPEHLRYTLDAQGNRIFQPQDTPGLTGPQANQQFQLVAAGQVLGRYGEMVNPDAPRNKDGKLQFIADSDFNFVFKSVNDGAAQGTSTYTVVKGDTLQSIARAQLGDADLWFTIAQANGLADGAGLEEGQVLRIPAVIVSGTNNDDGTFEAYDPTAIVGDTTPVIPQPPKKKKNVLKQIIIVVAAVVITVFTAGAAAFALGAVAQGTAMTLGTIMSAGASAMLGGIAVGGVAAGGLLGGGAAMIGGAVGSIASQGMNMAAGYQDEFSWKQVGISALGAGISAGIGGSAWGQAIGKAANVVVPGSAAYVTGAVSNIATQGIAKATGLQDSFSWRAVAASAVGAGIGQAVGGALNSTTSAFGPVQPAFSSLGDVGGAFARATVSGLAAGAGASVVMAKGGKIDLTRVAVDAFGQSLANSITGQIANAGQQEARAAQAAQEQAQSQAMADNRGLLNAANKLSDEDYYISSWGADNSLTSSATRFVPDAMSAQARQNADRLLCPVQRPEHDSLALIARFFQSQTRLFSSRRCDSLTNSVE